MQSSELAGLGYGPHSMLAQLAAAASLVLVAVGAAVFAATEFYPRGGSLVVPSRSEESSKAVSLDKLAVT